MEIKPASNRPTLAETKELDALKLQYQAFDDHVLLKWVGAVTGAHREAMAELLRERGHQVDDR